MRITIARGWAKRALVPAAVLVFAWSHLLGPFRWRCPSRVLFHVACPTCGISTAARALLQFHFAEATRVHPLALIVIPAVGIALFVELAGFTLTGHFGMLMNHKWARITGLALAVLLFAVWFARYFGAFGGPLKV